MKFNQAASLLIQSFLAVGLVSCGVPQPQSQLADAESESELSEKDLGIVNGSAASAAVKRSTVALDMGTSICSGTIISTKHILTAGHCVPAGTPASSVKIVFGADIASKVRRNSVKIHNELYKMDVLKSPDIAIVEFSGGLPSGYAPAVLPAPTAPLNTSQNLIVAGFGRNSNMNGNFGKLLMVTSKSSGAASNPIYFGFNTPQSGQQACFGDSGGPVYSAQNGRLVVVGVNHAVNTAESNGIKQCVQVSFHLSVMSQRSWIKTKTNL